MFERKGQGTTEYLIILAVVIVIALVVVGVMGWIPGLGTGLSESQSKAYWQSTSPFAITTYQVTGGATPILVLRNNTSQNLSVTTIKIGNTTVTAADANFTGGQEKSLTAAGSITCTSGNPYSYDVDINYLKTVGSSTVVLTQKGSKPLIGTCI